MEENKLELIDKFREKLIKPACEDIRRILEITCSSSGSENHGPNFIALSAILIVIETISQFTNKIEKKDLNSFKKTAISKYEELDPNIKKFLLPRFMPEDSDGSRLAVTFIKNYFDDIFSRPVNGCNGCLADIVWKYRNPQIHGYYPFISEKLRGSVLWLYKEPRNRMGVKIEEVEKEFDSYKNSLYGVEGEYFKLCPHILFVYFKFAIERYLDDIKEKPESIGDNFMKNYKRLADQYYFRDETDQDVLENQGKSKCL